MGRNLGSLIWSSWQWWFDDIYADNDDDGNYDDKDYWNDDGDDDGDHDDDDDDDGDDYCNKGQAEMWEEAAPTQSNHNINSLLFHLFVVMIMVKVINDDNDNDDLWHNHCIEYPSDRISNLFLNFK